jgi:ribonuclease PH
MSDSTTQPLAPDPQQRPRSDGRRPDQLRPVGLEPGYLELHPASCVARFGRTWVLCTASVEERVAPFLEGSGRGWITGVYGMLPGSVAERIAPARNSGGRAEEISRLLGRSLRATLDLRRLGPRTITIDCQVIQADGGTRTAAITGGYVALALALGELRARKLIASADIERQVAAVSVGLVDGQLLLDLAADEDTRAEADFNVVMTDGGAFVEVQGTAEGRPFERSELDGLLDLARDGIGQLLRLQREALADSPCTGGGSA